MDAANNLLVSEVEMQRWTSDDKPEQLTPKHERLQITRQLLKQAVEEARANIMSVSKQTPATWEAFVFHNVIVLIGPDGKIMGKAVRLVNHTWYCATSNGRGQGEWWLASNGQEFARWERYSERVDHTRIYGGYNLATNQYEEL